MKSPLNSSQTIAAVAVAAVLLAGAFALGRSQPAVVAPPADVVAEVAAPPVQPKPQPAKPQPEPAPVVAAAAPENSNSRLCNECSRVESVHSEERAGKSSGIGVIGGAVIGGLLGNQVGGGNGKKIATVGGAVAGGYAGNEIEKSRNSQRVWLVRTTSRDGSSHTHQVSQDPQLQSGDVVVWRDGRFERR